MVVANEELQPVACSLPKRDLMRHYLRRYNALRREEEDEDKYWADLRVSGAWASLTRPARSEED
jgi:hypothetical protein